MANEIKTITFIEELVHQNSAPMLFLCDDFEFYYCKSKLDAVDHDFLLYELLGSRLANYFDISTPETAIVRFDRDAMGNDFLQRNFSLEDGDLLFGSKNIGPNDHMDKTGRLTIKNKKQFQKLENPEDILKTTLLDIHLNNVDRHEENYNLLFQTQNSRYFAIDHTALFGGPALKGLFVPLGAPTLGNKLLNSFLLRNILKFLSSRQIDEIVNSYFSKCNSSLGIEVEEVFSSIPADWIISGGLKERMLAYSLDETRLELMKLLVLDRLHKIKNKL